MNKLLKHILFMLLALIVLLSGTFIFIRIYTGHGDPNVLVPLVEGERIDKAVQILEEGNFKYEITDTVYRDQLPLMSVVDQNPEPGFEVKPGRKIYLVVNSNEIPEVEMPALAGKTSYTQAMRILKSKGLRLGRKITRPHASILDPDSEPVLAQMLAGDTIPIRAGTRIKRHTRIDLVVGVMINPDEFPEGEGEPDSGILPEELPEL